MSIPISTNLKTAQNAEIRTPNAALTFRRLRLSFSEYKLMSNPWGLEDNDDVGGEPYVYGDALVTSGGYIFKFYTDGTITRYISTNTPGTPANWLWTDPGIIVPATGDANAGLCEVGGIVYVFYLSAGAALKYRTVNEDGTSWSSENNCDTATFPNGSTVAPVSPWEVYICGAVDGKLTVYRQWYDGSSWNTETCPYGFYGNETWAVTGTELGSVSRFDAVRAISHEFDSEPLLYLPFDGSLKDPITSRQPTVSTGGIIYPAHVTPPVGTGAVQLAEATVNLIGNPSAAIDMAWWDGAQTEFVRITSGGKIGNECFEGTVHITSYISMNSGMIIPCTGSQAYTLGFYYDADGTGDWVYHTRMVTTGVSDTLLSVDFNIRPDAQDSVYTVIAGNVSGSFGSLTFYSGDFTTMRLDAIQLEAKPYPTPTCIGDMGTGHSFSGTPHASSSSRTATALIYPITKNGTFTLSMWLSHPYQATDAIGYWGLFEWSYDAENAINLRYSPPSADMQLAWVRTGETNKYLTIAGGTYTPNTYYQYVVTWDGTTCRLYKDAIEVGTAFTAVEFATEPTELRVGLRGTTANQPNGWMDELVILDYALTPDEVTAEYEKRLAGQASAEVGSDVLAVTLNDPGESYIVRHKDDVWGDPQKLPGDEYGQLTLYRASVIDGKIWLTGRMYRPGAETIEAQAWDCVLVSEDGEHWEFHRDQYVHENEVRGQFLLLDGYVWYAGIETVYSAEATSIIDASDPAAMKTVVTTDLHGFTIGRARSGLSDSLAVQLADEDAQSSGDANIIAGAEVEIEAGYGGYDVQLAVGSIDTPERILADGQRAFQLSCRDRAFKFLKTFISPFYYPLLSQLKKHDDCDVMDNLYIINGGEYEPDAINDYIVYSSLAHDGILLSASPAEAKDVRLVATFETTVDPSDANSSFGIVLGHSDNDNYILVRVKTGTTNNVTLEKVVAGVTTVLDTQSFSITFNSKYDLAVSYEGGHIVAHLKQDAQSDFGDPIIDYAWTETEAPIRTDDGFGKSGVFTRIHSLQTGLLAFGSRSDAVPVDTADLADYADFPASGTLQAGTEKIAYTGKTGTSLALGSLTVNGVGPWRDYDNPGGTSEGDENYDFDGEYGVQIDGKGAVQVHTYYDNYAIVSVEGTGGENPRFYAAKIKGYVPEVPDEWTASVDGGEAHVGDLSYGAWTDIADRRVITDLSSLGGISDGDDVRIAPAFYGLTRAADSTNKGPHAQGDTIALYVDGEIRIHNLVVTDLEPDKTVEWMLKHIAAFAGIHNSSFKSLYSSTSLSVTGGGASAWHTAGTWLTGVEQRDFELSFEMPTLPTGDKLGIAVRASDIDWSSYTGASIVIEGLGSSQYSVGLFENGAGTALDKVNVDEPGTGVKVRLVSQGEFITLYFNDKFVWTWHSTSFQGTDLNYLGFSYYNGASISLSNVRVPELCERREAAAIDVNKSAMSSIGYVLEDRPVEIFATNDGGFLASYFDTRDDAGTELPGGVLGDEIFVEQIIPTDTNFFSVVQVYCEDVVELVDHALAAEFGFVFLPIQASAMSVAEGLKEAERVLTRSKEFRDTRTIQCKALTHLERGDELDIDYTSIHGDVINETVIINDINLMFANGIFEMKMGARKAAA